jgi:hypothetical protein
VVGLVLVLRGVFALGTFVIVAAAVLDAWASGQPFLALVAFVAAPLTFFVYPWIGGLEVVWVVSMVAFVAGNGAALRGAGGSRSDR